MFHIDLVNRKAKRKRTKNQISQILFLWSRFNEIAYATNNTNIISQDNPNRNLK